MTSADEIKRAIIPVLERFGVAKASLFGSFARGEQREDSDVDILIEFSSPEKKSLLDLVAIEQDISEILDRKADVLTDGSIHPLLKESIMNERVVFYERHG